jgi:acyl-CoA thioester hydrolase
MAAAMASDLPYQGRFVGRDHRFALRVYFEDTDFSGLVYHASYLRFMERARSDMLACAGIGQRGAFEGGQGVYAVAELSIKYVKPARFDDALLIISSVERLRAASVIIHQRVMRGDELLTQAQIHAAFLSSEGRPKRQPPEWIAAFETLLPAQSGL